jgi:hypothetical protein
LRCVRALRSPAMTWRAVVRLCHAARGARIVSKNFFAARLIAERADAARKAVRRTEARG